MLGWDVLQRRTVTELRSLRKDLRDKLAAEIQKRNALMAEIVWLQKELHKYEGDQE